MPAAHHVQAATVRVDEKQICHLIEACSSRDHRSGTAAEELRVIALENSAKVLIAGLGGIRPMVELVNDASQSSECREAAARVSRGVQGPLRP